MTTLLVLGAKGGVGASLFATNLALLIARTRDCLLLDGKPVHGTADVLLDLRGPRSWFDLLPVASELQPRQLELASVRHESGLRLLPAPEEYVQADLGALIPSLTKQCQWLIVDGWDTGRVPLGGAVTQVLLVTTPDTPALRGAARTVEALQASDVGMISLVLNQWSKSHPLSPRRLAASLEIPLLALLPFAPRAVAEQIEMGRPIVSRRQSHYTKSMENAVAVLMEASGTSGRSERIEMGADGD